MLKTFPIKELIHHSVVKLLIIVVFLWFLINFNSLKFNWQVNNYDFLYIDKNTKEFKSNIIIDSMMFENYNNILYPTNILIQDYKNCLAYTTIGTKVTINLLSGIILCNTERPLECYLSLKQAEEAIYEEFYNNKHFEKIMERNLASIYHAKGILFEGQSSMIWYAHNLFKYASVKTENNYQSINSLLSIYGRPILKYDNYCRTTPRDSVPETFKKVIINTCDSVSYYYNKLNQINDNSNNKESVILNSSTEVFTKAEDLKRYLKFGHIE